MLVGRAVGASRGCGHSWMVWALWAQRISYSLKASALTIGAVLSAPRSAIFFVLSIGVAFLVKDPCPLISRGSELSCCCAGWV